MVCVPCPDAGTGDHEKLYGGKPPSAKAVALPLHCPQVAFVTETTTETAEVMVERSNDKQRVTVLTMAVGLVG